VLKYAILQLLYRQPLSGYDIKKQFDSSLGFCWHAKHTQIYRELHRMKKEGLVNVQTELQEGKPNRHVYFITESGIEDLKQWLKTPVDEIKYKDELLLKIFSVHLLDKNSANQILDMAEKLHSQRLKEYEILSNKMQSKYFYQDSPVTSWIIGRYLDLQQGIMHEKMYLSWIKFAREYINKHSHLLNNG
jgi:DNA-binding PadR family transcriptional regulator